MVENPGGGSTGFLPIIFGDRLHEVGIFLKAEYTFLGFTFTAFLFKSFSKKSREVSTFPSYSLFVCIHDTDAHRFTTACQNTNAN